MGRRQTRLKPLVGTGLSGSRSHQGLHVPSNITCAAALDVRRGLPSISPCCCATTATGWEPAGTQGCRVSSSGLCWCCADPSTARVWSSWSATTASRAYDPPLPARRTDRIRRPRAGPVGRAGAGHGGRVHPPRLGRHGEPHRSGGCSRPRQDRPTVGQTQGPQRERAGVRCPGRLAPVGLTGPPGLAEQVDPELPRSAVQPESMDEDHGKRSGHGGPCPSRTSAPTRRGTQNREPWCRTGGDTPVLQARTGERP